MTKTSYFGKLNSTLGSVVPLAMFIKIFCYISVVIGKKPNIRTEDICIIKQSLFRNFRFCTGKGYIVHTYMHIG